MAIYNEVLSGRFARGIQKLFSIKGEVPVKQAAGEIITAHLLFSGVENRYLYGEERFGSTIIIAGAAATFTVFRLRNPAVSNVIVTIEKLLVSSSAAAGNAVAIDLSAATLDLATGMVSQRLDARTKPKSAMILSQTNLQGVAPTPTIMEFRLGQNVPVEVIQTINQEIQVLPGDALTVGINTANIEMGIGLFWRERHLEESERTS